MKKSFLVLTLALVGCGESPTLISNRHTVVLPEESMYQCERFTNYPIGTVTTNQVSRMIVELVRLNETCYNSQQAVRQFLNDARTRLQPAQTPTNQ